MQDQILYAMGALALLTFNVLLIIPIRRVRASLAGQIGPDDFKLGESARVPGNVAIPNRNYMNLTELPVLFYAICLMFYVTARTDMTTVWLAWAYVVSRVVHSLIHLTTNNVIHRLSAFAISNFVLLAMWVLFFAKGL
ncbi:MAG TPA: MAPEG family protein [Rhizomicrobium sp.]